MPGCPNETGKVGRLILPAALTQQHSNHFPRAKPGSAQRNTHKLGWKYQHCIGQQNHMVVQIKHMQIQKYWDLQTAYKNSEHSTALKSLIPFLNPNPRVHEQPCTDSSGYQRAPAAGSGSRAALCCPASSVCFGNSTCLQQKVFRSPTLTHQLLS